MAECYVCLEETRETSPCACKTALHESCYAEMQHKAPATRCTICRRSFDYLPPLPWPPCADMTRAVCLCVGIVILAFALGVIFASLL